jgi:hypothetical protein
MMAGRIDRRVVGRCGGPAALRISQQLWLHDGQGFKPEIREHSKGVIEISFDPKNAEARPMFVFLLLAVFGHVISV